MSRFARVVGTTSAQIDTLPLFCAMCAITIDADDFSPVPGGGELNIQVQADATVSRGGVSAGDSDSEWYWWLDPDGPCPPQC